jgi:predicted RNase H-like HicB family nuclease
MKEITFLVKEAEEGGYYVETAGIGIFSERETMEELKENIKGGIVCYFNKEEGAPAFRHLHFVEDEILAL